MQCSGCGAEISIAGSVCPFCGRDKSDDKSYEWSKFVGGVFGLVVGLTYYGGLVGFAGGALAGYFAGAVLGMILRARAAKPARVQRPPEPAKTPAAAPADASVAGKLAQLKQMHGEGLLTDDEYAAKKADVLARF